MVSATAHATAIQLLRSHSLTTLVQRERNRFRLVSGAALEVRPAATDHDGVVAELVALLRRLTAA